ncbi:hypothetical protein ACIPR8_19000 [Stenotrophomonas sp. LARHCG68]
MQGEVSTLRWPGFSGVGQVLFIADIKRTDILCNSAQVRSDALNGLNVHADLTAFAPQLCGQDRSLENHIVQDQLFT